MDCLVFRFLIFICFLQICMVNANSRDWANIFTSSSVDFNATAISSECLRDYNIWIASLKQIGRVSGNCLVKNSCTEEDKKILEDNLYALQQLDSFGRLPSGLMELTRIDIGSYAECNAISGVKYETHYCYMNYQPNVELAGNNYRKLLANIVPGANELPADPKCTIDVLEHAVCMPKSCTEEDLPKIMNAHNMLPVSHYCTAKCAGDHPPKKDAVFWIITVFFCIVALIVISSSVVDYFLQNVIEDGKIMAKKPAIRALLSFSMYTNANILLSTEPAPPSHIASLDCIRAFSMSWVVSGHALIQFVVGDSLMPISRIFNPFLNTVYLNAFFSVDSFFVLSGIVVAYIFFRHVKKREIRKPITWIMYYFHRYWRLTPPMIFFIFFIIAYAQYIDGPVQAAGAMDFEPLLVSSCRQYWYENLFYFNNFNPNNQCYPIFWYLAVDTQIFLVMPIFLCALYISMWIGLASILLGIAGSVAVTTYIVYHYNLPPTAMSLRLSNANSSMLFFNDYYVKPWTRAPPYLIGLFVGYLLAVKLKKNMKLHWSLILTGWAVATAVALACLFGTHDYLDGSDDWGKFWSAFYNNFSRIGWSLSLCWVVVANHVGWGGPINSFMSYPIWQPLGRLSYSAYIVHFLTVDWFFNLMDRPPHYVSIVQTMLFYALPITIISYFFAFFWSCGFEIPFIKLEKVLLEGVMRRPQESSKSDNKTQSNGISTRRELSKEEAVTYYTEKL